MDKLNPPVAADKKHRMNKGTPGGESTSKKEKKLANKAKLKLSTDKKDSIKDNHPTGISRRVEIIKSYSTTIQNTALNQPRAVCSV
jgi:hypothetical protein